MADPANPKSEAMIMQRDRVRPGPGIVSSIIVLRISGAHCSLLTAFHVAMSWLLEPHPVPAGQSTGSPHLGILGRAACMHEAETRGSNTKMGTAEKAIGIPVALQRPTKSCLILVRPEFHLSCPDSAFVSVLKKKLPTPRRVS